MSGPRWARLSTSTSTEPQWHRKGRFHFFLIVILRFADCGIARTHGKSCVLGSGKSGTSFSLDVRSKGSVTALTPEPPLLRLWRLLLAPCRVRALTLTSELVLFGRLGLELDGRLELGSLPNSSSRHITSPALGCEPGRLVSAWTSSNESSICANSSAMSATAEESVGAPAPVITRYPP